MKKIIASLLTSLALVGGVHASGGGVAWDRFPTEKMSDMAALQNGAVSSTNQSASGEASQRLIERRPMAWPFMSPSTTAVPRRPQGATTACGTTRNTGRRGSLR